MTNIVTTAKALNKALQQPAMPLELLSVANRHLNGESIEEIASSMECSEERIITTLDNASVKKYINGRLQAVGFLNRKNRLDLINQLIENKIEAEGATSEKDIVELIKLAQAEQRDIEPKAPTNQINVQNKTTNIENLLMRIADDTDDKSEVVDAEVVEEKS